MLVSAPRCLRTWLEALKGGGDWMVGAVIIRKRACSPVWGRVLGSSWDLSRGPLVEHLFRGLSSPQQVQEKPNRESQAEVVVL